MRKRILVDVDLTVVHSDLAWRDWLINTTGVNNLVEDYKLDYNISNYWKEELLYLGIDPYDFWRNKDLYESMTPMKGSVDVLGKLCQLGYNIVFVSHVKGHSGYSKANFLKKYFPFAEGMVFTQEKWLVANQDTVAMIDDRTLHLNRMPPHVKKVVIPTPYVQDEPYAFGTKIFKWEDGVNFFIEEILSAVKSRVYGFY